MLSSYNEFINSHRIARTLCGFSPFRMLRKKPIDKFYRIFHKRILVQMNCRVQSVGGWFSKMERTSVECRGCRVEGIWPAIPFRRLHLLLYELKSSLILLLFMTYKKWLKNKNANHKCFLWQHRSLQVKFKRDFNLF